MEKEKNCWIIPTEKPSKLYEFVNKIYLNTIPKEYYKKFHLYITSDIKIKKENLPCYVLYNKSVQYIDQINVLEEVNKECTGKIILTTNPDLIKDGVQEIDNEFLEWFCSNPSCEFVKLKDVKLLLEDGFFTYGYKIIIPQKEPKELIDLEIAVKLEEVEREEREQEPCNNCGKSLREQMKGCNEITCYRQFLNKQETLEEAAKRAWLDYNKTNSNFTFSSVFALGAKWQTENIPIHILDVDNILVQIKDGVVVIEKNNKLKRMYSEEDMRKMYDKSCGLIGLGLLDNKTENNNRFNELLDQLIKEKS